MASWFDTTQLTSYAKSALNDVQKTLDKALDIKEEEEKKAREKAEAEAKAAKADGGGDGDPTPDDRDETESVSSVASSASSAAAKAAKAAKALTSGSKMWGSFTGSFFDAGQMQQPDPGVEPIQEEKGQ